MRTLALVALVVLCAGALADHVYSHRFVLEGRLLGSDGAPIPGRVVEFFAEGEDFLEPCREGPHQSVTDEWGDFRFCFHHHDLQPGASVGARAGNASAVRTVDVAFRRVVVTLEDPERAGEKPADWERTFRIAGRAWEVGPVELEGVLVYGVAAVDLPVNLTVQASDGSKSVFPTRTDAFGDFDLVIEAPDPANVSLSLEAMGRAQPAHLDTRSHRTYAPIYLPGEAQRAAPSAPPTGLPAPPGSATPSVNPVLLVALALGLVAAIALSRRKT